MQRNRRRAGRSPCRECRAPARSRRPPASGSPSIERRRPAFPDLVLLGHGCVEMSPDGRTTAVAYPSWATTPEPHMRTGRRRPSAAKHPPSPRIPVISVERRCPKRELAPSCPDHSSSGWVDLQTAGIRLRCPMEAQDYDRAVARAIRYPRPGLVAGGFILRRFREDDFEIAYANDQDSSTVRWIGPLPGSSGSEVVRYNERARRQGKSLALTIAEKDTDAYMGEVLLFARQWDVAELAYVVVAAARGRGIATEAVCLVGDWAFEKLGIQRLQLMVAVDNDASHRVAAKSGYRREGLLRSAYEVRGVRTDMVMYSRLPTDSLPL